ncbi:alpha-ketoglutarate-dependent dioxygenase AlkB [uncultured Sulfitobacter sp.]|uniref:alpha-ketoglutarate-dependent dioxygenase AlkB family protein n=1 Tax=uncultured Sulfitobacter sp. TaxID=191468 RepID=UPI002604FEDF|nr:alpha-ketoglutarate-dependent dioxygenase AlkB [uncultured Sulfitobacter sp.]
MVKLSVKGFDIHSGCLDIAAQRAVLTAVRGVVADAPFFRPDTPYGKPMSVRMSAAGQYGWYSDKKGYRYVRNHPSGRPWPAIPEPVLDIWRDVTGLARMPECCLINYYGAEAKMGLHQDRDEASMEWPVVSVSLGDDGLFRMGNVTRGGKTESHWLRSGDVVVMGGDARLAYHGVDRIRSGSSTLLPKGGRLNLTLRVVT